MFQQKRISDVFDLVRGISFPKSARDEISDEYVGCIRTANVQKEILWDDLWKVPKSYVKNEEQFLQINDIIVSTANSLRLLGKAAIIRDLPETSSFGTFVICLRPKEDYSPKYLYYTLQAKPYFDQIQKLASTTTNISNISGAKLKTVTIPVPSLKEQHRIVSRIEELFSELDNSVSTLRKTKEQLAVYRQAVLKEAFSTETHAVKKTCEIGEVCLGRQRSPKNISKYYPTKYIRAANITETGLELNDILEMEFTPVEREKYYLLKGDIVISEASGSATQVGKPAVWNGEIENCCFQNTVIRLRLKKDLPEYVYWYLKFLYSSGAIAKIAGGVGINHLVANKFSNIEIPIPDKEEQKRIVSEIESRLSVCDSIEHTVDTALQQAEAMRQSILKQAFEGRL